MHMFQENGFKGPYDLQGPSEPNLGYMYVYGAGRWGVVVLLFSIL